MSTSKFLSLFYIEVFESSSDKVPSSTEGELTVRLVIAEWK